jgi:amino-acid N-acetyltransferase
MWEDLGEIRTLAVDPGHGGRGIGGRILDDLIQRARTLGLARLFCLTFEVEFFRSRGFEEIEGSPVDHAVFEQLLQSYDEGVAEFLDLERVKPNTLGNHRMLMLLR